MFWRYILAGLCLLAPFAVYFAAKWLSDALPLPVFGIIAVAFMFGCYRLGCWMDRKGWKAN